MNKLKKKTIKSSSCVNYWAIGCITVLVAVLFWCLAIISAKCFNFVITNEQIIASIAGILATFVVISNIVQVEAIKREFEGKVAELDDKLEKVRNLRVSNAVSLEVFERAKNNWESRKLASRMFSSKNSTFSVISADPPYGDGKIHSTAKWAIDEDEHIFFYDKDDSERTPIKGIMMVDELGYEQDEVEILLKIYQKGVESHE